MVSARLLLRKARLSFMRKATGGGPGGVIGLVPAVQVAAGLGVLIALITVTVLILVPVLVTICWVLVEHVL
jgi:hypothetical protein